MQVGMEPAPVTIERVSGSREIKLAGQLYTAGCYVSTFKEKRKAMKLIMSMRRIRLSN